MTGLVILHDPQTGGPYAGGWRRFANPIEIVSARSPAEVLPALHYLEEQVQTRKWYAAGCIAYEAAPAFDTALRVRAASPVGAIPRDCPDALPADFPLLWFGLYDRVEEIDLPARSGRAVPELTWQPTISWAEYERAIHTIKDHIAAGCTYQVNYTYRLRAPFQADPWQFFLYLARRQSRYAAYLDLGRWAVCSASPELFFQLRGTAITSRPMKGTAPRGRTLAEDAAHMAWLRCSEKNRAENVMIVDMIRNDLGRIAQIGSVDVPQLFEVEHYPTVLQMTSTVTAQTTASFTEILRALFPCASITGAPKVSTMKIIADLETTPRGLYTGAIGYLGPDRTAQFNVAIRTVTVDRETGQAEYGVGGGIVWDSDAADEFRECEIKTNVLTSPPLEFELLEALLWRPVTDGTPAGDYFLLGRHMARLRDSAEYFGFPFDGVALRDQLAEAARCLPAEEHKVRVALSRLGDLAISATPLAQIARPPVLRVALAQRPIDSANVFLYHKTSRRAVYESVLAARGDADEVILWNEHGEITEACTANVVIELDGERLTPPIDCGLLGGTFRAELLAQGQIVERVITIEMLRRARRVFLINSVRKWMSAELLSFSK
jgi:para-aminobenzoate synthetase/4-amino-4-deoxychorismate lyase